MVQTNLEVQGDSVTARSSGSECHMTHGSATNLLEDSRSVRSGFRPMAMFRQGIGLTTDLYDLSVLNMVRSEFEECYGQLTPWENGAMTSASSAGAIVGQLLFGQLADRLGRRKMFVCTSALMFLGAAGAALTVPTAHFSAGQLMVFWRFMLGVGIGGEYPLSGAMTAEQASAKDSGCHMAMLCLCFFWGQILAPLVVLICLYCEASAQMTWRVSIAFGAALALAGFVARFSTMTESEAWVQARATGCQGKKSSLLKSLGRPLAGTILVWLVYSIVSDGTGGYTTMLFRSSTHIDTTWNSLLIVLLSAPGYLFTLCVNRIGRRCFLLTGFSLMGLTLLSISILRIEKRGSSLQVLLFGLQKSFDAFGPGAMTFMIPAEIFPTVVRASCHGASAAGGKLGSFLGMLLLPPFQAAFGFPAVLAASGLLCFIGSILTLGLIPPYDAQTLRNLSAQTSHGDLSLTTEILWRRAV